MRWLKIGSVIFGAVAITALGIDAADTLQGSRTTLLGQLISSEVIDGVCPEGMIEVGTATTFSCVDIYEASPSESCPVLSPKNILDTKKNTEDAACEAFSAADVEPWRFIDRENAQLVCTRAGKRLPTNEEWQLIAAGTPEGDCEIDSNAAAPTGSNGSCLSAVGIYDAVGNVWEWTHDDVFDGEYNGRPLPEEGYVQQVDKGGVATVTGTSSSEAFGQDYMWSKETGAYAMMRGGFYGSESDAGVYTLHAATLPTLTTGAIGFRCVR